VIFDANAFIGKWPYWPIAATTGAEVSALLTEWGIAQAAVCSTRSLFVNWEDGNVETEREAAASGGALVPMACLGPLELSHKLPGKTYDFDAYAGRGFRGVRLYPQHHSYHPLYEASIEPILEDAARRGWPVMLPLRVIMNWGVPMLDIGVMAALITHHRQVTWILAGINYLFELQMAISMMRRFERVHLETSCIMGFEAIAKTVQQVGAERLLFGSGSPLQNGAAGVAKIAHASISDAAREAIFHANARRLFGLTS
jgi:hypothetical protein